MTESTVAHLSRLASPSSAGRSRLLVALVALLVVAAACGGGADDDANATSTTAAPDGNTEAEEPDPETAAYDGPVTVVIPNSPGSLTTSGSQRVMTALVGSAPNTFLGGPDEPVTIAFSAVNNDDAGEAAGTFLTTNAAALGLYVSYFEFPSAGLWEIAVLSNGGEVGKTLFEVTEESPIPTIGDAAPATESLTGETPDEIAAISTDQDPIASYYDLSIAEAITNDRPTVVAFVTPAFCQTALCGPTLETVKEATAGRDDLDVVHVEPFDLELAPQGTLRPIPSMEDWGLVTEPWVFVIDADGIVTANFEGIIGLAELERALAAL